MNASRWASRPLLWTGLVALVVPSIAAGQSSAPPPSVAGVYPHLAFWNTNNECGTGAVVPWAGQLWAITYAPHAPKGSDDRLYSIAPDLTQRVHPASVGGTPANRFIHTESNQLFLGPYVIDGDGSVRVIPPDAMYGRLTGTARHLFEPEDKVYMATMEEGLYEIDVATLEVRELFRDEQLLRDGDGKVPAADLPGYHGKGLYTGQGRLIYSNNGERGREAQSRPDIPSGVLAEWDGKSSDWTIIRRAQFTDVRGPGDLRGNADPANDPVWAIGWDHRSLLLMLLDEGHWSTYRLPKAAHTYDGAHGWNTEWPRFRDLGEDDFALNMHGTLWRFPRGFRREASFGIAPRSTYLRVVGDYCRWGDRLIFGCDDTAKAEFLNKRRAKGDLAGPGQSNSNLWFLAPEDLDRLGPSSGAGAVWRHDDVAKNAPSDPYLFSGYAHRVAYAFHGADAARSLTLEVDKEGTGSWTELRTVAVPPRSGAVIRFPDEERGVWIRARFDQATPDATLQFHSWDSDAREAASAVAFSELASANSRASLGLVRVRGNELKTLAFAAATRSADGKVGAPRLYELNGDLELTPTDDETALAWTIDNTKAPDGIVTADAASLIYVDDDERRWRLPRRAADSGRLRDGASLGPARICREVATERDLFHAGGTFYELPARNAGGFPLVRPIASHPFEIFDYCSYRGLLILTGVRLDEASTPSGRIVRSSDGAAALWTGVIDDLWRLGKPTGVGGPWQGTRVSAGQRSDPYLMRGFDQKTLRLSTTSAEQVSVEVLVDVTGGGDWLRLVQLQVSASKPVEHALGPDVQAYWVALRSDRNATLTGQFEYR